PISSTKTRQAFPVVFLSIAKSNGISPHECVYLTTEGVYHQPRAVFFRNDDMQCFALVIYTPRRDLQKSLCFS
ncbi:MAG: hypothetical protein IJD89_06275, partial [Clostridia bacterium]|nr:hypothetical protein [Clostridia bacterium]